MEYIIAKMREPAEYTFTDVESPCPECGTGILWRRKMRNQEGHRWYCRACKAAFALATVPGPERPRKDAMARLDEDIITLVRWRPMSVREAALRLGVKENTIRDRLRRTKNAEIFDSKIFWPSRAQWSADYLRRKQAERGF